MLTRVDQDCPVFGGKVKSFDAARVSGMRGVKKWCRSATPASR